MFTFQSHFKITRQINLPPLQKQLYFIVADLSSVFVLVCDLWNLHQLFNLCLRLAPFFLAKYQFYLAEPEVNKTRHCHFQTV